MWKRGELLLVLLLGGGARANPNRANDNDLIQCASTAGCRDMHGPAAQQGAALTATGCA